MDEQRIQDRVSEAAEKVGETIGTMAGDSTKQAGRPCKPSSIRARR
jgi:hypothetical protein